MSRQLDLGALHAPPTSLATGVARGDRQLAGFFLFVLAAEFLTAIMLGASMAPGYDIRAGAISDLGTIPETALLFNLSLVAIGVLDVAGGFLLYRTHGSAWVLAIFSLAGLGSIGAGLFPLHTSDLHSLFALFAFVFFNLQPLTVLGLVPRTLKAISVLATVLGLGFVVLMIIGDAGNPGVFGAIGHAGAERMIVYPAMLWMLVFSGYLMATPRGHVLR